MAIDQAKLKDAIKSALDDMFDTKLASLDIKLGPLRTSMDFISKSFDGMNKKIAALEKTNVELAKENHLTNKNSIKARLPGNQRSSHFIKRRHK